MFLKRPPGAICYLVDTQSHHHYRDRCVYAPSQWETTLHCNVLSHWLGAYMYEAGMILCIHNVYTQNHPCLYMPYLNTADKLLGAYLEYFGENKLIWRPHNDTVKPVCNDHLYNKMYYLWFIQSCVLVKTEGTNLLVLTISAFCSSSRWPLAT